MSTTETFDGEIDTGSVFGQSGSNAARLNTTSTTTSGSGSSNLNTTTCASSRLSNDAATLAAYSALVDAEEQQKQAQKGGKNHHDDDNDDNDDDDDDDDYYNNDEDEDVCHVSTDKKEVLHPGHPAVQSSEVATMFFVAVSRSQVHKALSLLKEYSELRIQMITVHDAHGYTPLISACRHGLIEIVRAILTTSTSATNSHTSSSTSTRLSGTTNSSMSMLSTVVNHQTNLGNDALITACRGGHEAIVKDLIEAGANVHAHNVNRETPLIWACMGGHDQIAHALIHKCNVDPTVATKQKLNALMCACSQPASVACARILLNAASTLVDTQNEHGHTPMHFALESGDLECVRLLLDRGAALNIPTVTGVTAIQYQKITQDRAICKLMRKTIEARQMETERLAAEIAHLQRAEEHKLYSDSGVESLSAVSKLGNGNGNDNGIASEQDKSSSSSNKKKNKKNKKKKKAKRKKAKKLDSVHSEHGDSTQVLQELVKDEDDIDSHSTSSVDQQEDEISTQGQLGTAALVEPDDMDMSEFIPVIHAKRRKQKQRNNQAETPNKPTRQKQPKRKSQQQRVTQSKPSQDSKSTRVHASTAARNFHATTGFQSPAGSWASVADGSNPTGSSGSSGGTGSSTATTHHVDASDKIVSASSPQLSIQTATPPPTPIAQQLYTTNMPVPMTVQVESDQVSDIYSTMREAMQEVDEHAQALDLRPEHMFGINVHELSMAQLTALEDLHRHQLADITQIKFNGVVEQVASLQHQVVGLRTV
jgi:ankyrin repeat protein